MTSKTAPAAKAVEIYTTNYCPYCQAAKALLAKLQVPFQEIDCTTDPAKRTWLLERTGRRTVPQIFVGEAPIGGYDDLVRLVEEGAFAKILSGELAVPAIL